VRLFLASARFQLWLVRREPDNLHVFVTTPLLALVFVAIAEHARRPDLAGYAILAPALMSLLTMVLFLAGAMISEEREQGTLEALVAAPVRLATIMLGRLAAVTLACLVCVLEAGLVAGLVFGRWVTVHHPMLFALSLVVTGLAMAGTATVLSSAFVLFPSARTIQNTLTYPVYLLAGVLVPITLLPVWVQPLSRLMFLSWSADLLRDSLSAAPVAQPVARLAVVAALGLIGYAMGIFLINRFLRHARRHGTLSHT
jgi:ABC-2 type transport system permease protein